MAKVEIRSRWNFRKQREGSARRAGRGAPAPAVARSARRHLAVVRHDTVRRLDQALVLERADVLRGHGHARPLKQLERDLARLAPAGALAIEAEVAVLGIAKARVLPDPSLDLVSGGLHRPRELVVGDAVLPEADVEPGPLLRETVVLAGTRRVAEQPGLGCAGRRAGGTLPAVEHGIVHVLEVGPAPAVSEGGA